MDGDTLFSMAAEAEQKTFAPLAVRMRPETLDDVYGQEELLGEGSFLRAMIERDTVPSLLFYGPSGVGKRQLPMSLLRRRRVVLSGLMPLQRELQNYGLSSRRPRMPLTCIKRGQSFS